MATVTTGAVTAAAVPAAGYKSSEFVVTVGTMVGMLSGLVPAQYGPMLAAVVGVYVASRTALKAVHTLGYAKAVPDLPDVASAVQAAVDEVNSRGLK